MHTPTTPLKALAVTAASAGLLLSGGFAAAYAGVLPGAAQDAAQDVLDSINVQVPGANEHSAGHADDRGRSDEAPPTSSDTDSTNTLPDAAAFGQMISELAQSTEGGREKGDAISQAASVKGQEHRHESAPAPEQSAAGGDEAQAPQAGSAAEGTGGQSGDHARVETPNGGGTSTADGASAQGDGAVPSSNGTGTAGEKSGGRSTAGSGNANTP